MDEAKLLKSSQVFFLRFACPNIPACGSDVSEPQSLLSCEVWIVQCFLPMLVEH
jgi:hypothetical protein